MSTAIHQRYLARLETLLADGRRKSLGLAGPPGCGKSTLSEGLQAAFPGRSVVVPMDGFHLANSELARLGRAARKGAPDTFDIEGYVALLGRLKAQRADETVYAPVFRREIEEAIAGAIAIEADVQLVITEGNYLLMDSGHWTRARDLLDEIWFVNTDNELRHRRLVQRHIEFGRAPQAARDWVAATDDPNSRLVETNKALADVQFFWEPE